LGFDNERPPILELEQRPIIIKVDAAIYLEAEQADISVHDAFPLEKGPNRTKHTLAPYFIYSEIVQFPLQRNWAPCDALHSLAGSFSVVKASKHNRSFSF
jgi:hypothetical protein